MAGLYVHVPFCETKCGYCDFYSVPLQGRNTTPLVRAIATELGRRGSTVGAKFTTIFVGGGTPTLLPLGELETLFGQLSVVARRDGVAEFTTEANPATVDQEKIKLLVEAGVNRMSFGGQSFHQKELDVLERLHSPADIVPGVRLARAGGIEQINLDLIFGIPGQTLDSWRESLRRAVDLGIDHVACYGLTYEPGTPLTAQMQKGTTIRCDNDLEAEMYLLAIEFLQSCGFGQYEISNFAKPGCQCRHNMIYWSNQPYLGIGPSAASYIDGGRCKNVPHIETYIGDIENGRNAWREIEKLTQHQLAGETAMLQLRLNRGIDIVEFSQQVGLNPLEFYADQISRYTAEGLMKCTSEHIQLTRDGRLVADRIISDFLADPVAAGSDVRCQTLDVR